DEKCDGQAVHEAFLDGRRAVGGDKRRLARPGGASGHEGNRGARVAVAARTDHARHHVRGAEPRRYCRSHDQSRLGTSYMRSEEHTSELQSRFDLVCRLLLEKKKHKNTSNMITLMM